MKDGVKILIVRHGETDMAGRFCGSSDPALNSRGEKQVESLLGILRARHIDAVHASTLHRAKATGEAIAKSFSAHLFLHAGLQEIDFGDWDGLTWQEIELRDPAYAQRWLADFPNLPAPNGEQIDGFRNRVIDTITKLVSLGVTQRLVVVTHAGVMRVILNSLCGIDERTSWLVSKPYCSYFEYPMTEHEAGRILSEY